MEKTIKIADLHLHAGNPRTIKDDRFKQLVKSIKDFPKMMELRPIIVDDKNIIVGGNQRFKALQELGMQEIPATWVRQAADFTPAELREFMIKDNIQFGQFDWTVLKADWIDKDLLDFGITLEDMPELEQPEKPPKTKTTDIHQITFHLSSSYKQKLLDILAQLDSNKDAALCKLIDEVEVLKD